MKLSSTDTMHQPQLISLFSLFGSIVLLSFSVNTLIRGIYSLFWVEFIISIFLFLSYYIATYQRLLILQNANRYFTLLSLLSLGLFLVQAGGIKNTGPLWIFVIPPVIFAFCGFSLGIIYNILFLIAIGILLFYPEEQLLSTTYNYVFKSRLLYAYTVSFFLFGFYEAARAKSHLELEKLKNKFEIESMQDDLTKLSNRRYMWETLHHQQDNADRNSTFVIALLDIDHFKKVNDTYGHDIGDEVLIHISTIIKTGLRPHDKIARWGGEEFLILLPNTNEFDAFSFLETLRKRVYKVPYVFEKKSIPISISIGFTQTYPCTNLTKVIKQADQFLYQAKTQGRNKVVY